MSYMGHVLMENRNGLTVDARFSAPGYHEEPMAALEMAQGITDGGKRLLELINTMIQNILRRD